MRGDGDTESTSREALAGSTFEGADGNLVPNGGTDWGNVPNLASKPDLVKGQGDDTFGGGVKEDSTPKFMLDAIPPNKTDLTRLLVASDTTGPHVFLYLGWERTADTGDANLDFEFDQATPPTGSPVPARTAGDILVTYDFGGNGTVQLGLLTWITTAPADPTQGCFAHLDNAGNPVINGSPPCWGKRVDLTKAGFAEGAVNGVTVTDPTNGNASLAPHLFGEAAIDLTAAGVISPTQCKAFHTSTAHSRSSTAFDSTLQDFVGPLGVNVDTCEPATVRLKKTNADGTVPLAGAVLQLWHDVNKDGIIKPADDVQIGSDCTTDATGYCPTDFTVTVDGKYIGHEVTPPPGYSPASDPAAVDITLTSSPQTITIEFHDAVVPGKITIHKQDDAGNPVVGAGFTVYHDNAPTGGSPGAEDTQAGTCTTNTSGDCAVNGLAPGAYWVVETSTPLGYTNTTPFKPVTVPLGSTPDTGGEVSVMFVNPRVFRIIVMVCKEDGTLVPSTIDIDGINPSQTSINATQAATAGFTEKGLCGIGQAAFGGLAAGNHTGTMNIP